MQFSMADCPYEMTDDGGSAIWMAIDHINHHRFLDAWSRQNHISTTIEAVAVEEE
jgi:hypothetical protein